ncbi:TonB-dependent receptor [Flammeovirga kamogawensis]|uniref:TonB-dependent receptor n=1 Tax=Flammeovirga kamogawensis TaxID=373891 RepID=A0ABX8GZF1_9BACT|nr:TonB-dependent receptor [Flammeovirga kamogawensis]MBB6459230.1 iron complex outermembrane receptor protein [Flammeovirga kamogawensis]QWG08794.1 TonB-dependent receptor [Flammeovirga kamogawensis]TRX67084.1 TonB-dependent receptor [Flammeovirga kamogawensis]
MKFIQVQLLTLLIFLSSTAFSQEQKSMFDEDSVTALSEIVISSSFLATQNTPVTYEDLLVSDISFKNVGQEPSFLLSESPSMTVYSDAGGMQGYTYFRLRGIDQSRINITLDGVPLNEPEDQGFYFANFGDFLNSVSSIQIQRGVGTTKNGTASYGGSLQFSSINLYEPKYAKVEAGYGSFNSYRLAAEYNSGVKNDKAIYARISTLGSDNYKYNADNRSTSGFVSAGLFKEKYDLRFTTFVGNQQNGLAWAGVSQEQIDIDPQTNANINERDNFTQSFSQLSHKWSLSDRSTLNTSVFYSYVKGNYDYNPLGYDSDPDSLLNYALESNFAGFFTNYTYEVENLQWTTGVLADFYARDHNGTNNYDPSLFYTNTGYKNEASVFTKAMYSIGKFYLFADLQYRYASFDYDGDVPFDKLEWNFFNPKGGVTYNASASTSLYYSIGRTGREPTRTDMFGANDNLLADSTGAALLGGTEPEYVVDQELGVRFNKGRWNVELNGFYMDFENEYILQGPLGPNGLPITGNVESSFRTGVELDAKYAIHPNWDLRNTTSYNYTQVEDQDVKFHHILTPEWIINQDIVYHQGKFEIGTTLRFQSESYIDNANENTIDGYFLLNARVSYIINKNLQVSVLGNNLTNASYYNYGYVDAWDNNTNKYLVTAPVNFYGNIAVTF